MKEIKAYIQPFMLQKVTDALHKIHVRGMSVNEIKGFGKEKDEAYPHHSKDYVTEFTPKVKLEIACHDEEVAQIIKCIKEHAHTGRKGDGKIFVTTLEHVVSIRTGETDTAAL
ncbi:MAG: P-II family nitrogen regulator [Candidatus Omnitrophica bacterium]|nr:P-II family nitrogen regulator [Candidatus Omnitrophota bacterium]